MERRTKALVVAAAVAVVAGVTLTLVSLTGGSGSKPASIDYQAQYQAIANQTNAALDSFGNRTSSEPQALNALTVAALRIEHDTWPQEALTPMATLAQSLNQFVSDARSSDLSQIPADVQTIDVAAAEVRAVLAGPFSRSSEASSYTWTCIGTACVASGNVRLAMTPAAPKRSLVTPDPVSGSVLAGQSHEAWSVEAGA